MSIYVLDPDELSVAAASAIPGVQSSLDQASSNGSALRRPKSSSRANAKHPQQRVTSAVNMRREVDSRRIAIERPASSPLHRGSDAFTARFAGLAISGAKKAQEQLANMNSNEHNSNNNNNRGNESYDYERDIYDPNLNPDIVLSTVLTEKNSALAMTSSSSPEVSKLAAYCRSLEESKGNNQPLVLGERPSGSQHSRSGSPNSHRHKSPNNHRKSPLLDRRGGSPGGSRGHHVTMFEREMENMLSADDQNALSLGRLVLGTMLENPDLKTTESLSRFFFDYWLAKNNSSLKEADPLNVDLMASMQNSIAKARYNAAHAEKPLKRGGGGGGEGGGDQDEGGPVTANDNSIADGAGDGAVAGAVAKGKAAAAIATSDKEYISPAVHMNKIAASVALESFDVLIRELGHSNPVLKDIRAAIVPIIFKEARANKHLLANNSNDNYGVLSREGSAVLDANGSIDDIMAPGGSFIEAGGSVFSYQTANPAPEKYVDRQTWYEDAFEMTSAAMKHQRDMADVQQEVLQLKDTIKGLEMSVAGANKELEKSSNSNIALKEDIKGLKNQLKDSRNTSMEWKSKYEKECEQRVEAESKFRAAYLDAAENANMLLHEGKRSEEIETKLAEAYNSISELRTTVKDLQAEIAKSEKFVKEAKYEKSGLNSRIKANLMWMSSVTDKLVDLTTKRGAVIHIEMPEFKVNELKGFVKERSRTPSLTAESFHSFLESMAGSRRPSLQAANFDAGSAYTAVPASQQQQQQQQQDAKAQKEDGQDVMHSRKSIHGKSSPGRLSHSKPATPKYGDSLLAQATTQRVHSNHGLDTMLSPNSHEHFNTALNKLNKLNTFSRHDSVSMKPKLQRIVSSVALDATEHHDFARLVTSDSQLNLDLDLPADADKSDGDVEQENERVCPQEVLWRELMSGVDKEDRTEQKILQKYIEKWLFAYEVGQMHDLLDIKKYLEREVVTTNFEMEHKVSDLNKTITILRERYQKEMQAAEKSFDVFKQNTAGRIQKVEEERNSLKASLESTAAQLATMTEKAELLGRNLEVSARERAKDAREHAVLVAGLRDEIKGIARVYIVQIDTLKEQILALESALSVSKQDLEETKTKLKQVTRRSKERDLFSRADLEEQKFKYDRIIDNFKHHHAKELRLTDIRAEKVRLATAVAFADYDNTIHHLESDKKRLSSDLEFIKDSARLSEDTLMAFEDLRMRTLIINEVEEEMKKSEENMRKIMLEQEMSELLLAEKAKLEEELAVEKERMAAEQAAAHSAKEVGRKSLYLLNHPREEDSGSDADFEKPDLRRAANNKDNNGSKITRKMNNLKSNEMLAYLASELQDKQHDLRGVAKQLKVEKVAIIKEFEHFKHMFDVVKTQLTQKASASFVAGGLSNKKVVPMVDASCATEEDLAVADDEKEDYNSDDEPFSDEGDRESDENRGENVMKKNQIKIRYDCKRPKYRGDEPTRTVAVQTKPDYSSMVSNSKRYSIAAALLETQRNSTQASPHKLSQPFLHYIRKHEKIYAREIGLMQIVIREFRGLYERILRKFYTCLDASVLSNELMPPVVVQNIGALKTELEDNSWIFDPDFFRKNLVAASYGDDPVDTSAQAHNLHSWRKELAAAEKAKGTDDEVDPDVETALRGLVDDIRSDVQHQGGWRALLYRTDGSVDMGMNLTAWSPEDQIAILKEQLRYIQHEHTDQLGKLREAIGSHNKFTTTAIPTSSSSSQPSTANIVFTDSLTTTAGGDLAELHIDTSAPVAAATSSIVTSPTNNNVTLKVARTPKGSRVSFAELPSSGSAIGPIQIQAPSFQQSPSGRSIITALGEEVDSDSVYPGSLRDGASSKMALKARITAHRLSVAALTKAQERQLLKQQQQQQQEQQSEVDEELQQRKHAPIEGSFPLRRSSVKPNVTGNENENGVGARRVSTVGGSREANSRSRSPPMTRMLSVNTYNTGNAGNAGDPYLPSTPKSNNLLVTATIHEAIASVASTLHFLQQLRAQALEQAQVAASQHQLGLGGTLDYQPSYHSLDENSVNYSEAGDSKDDGVGSSSVAGSKTGKLSNPLQQTSVASSSSGNILGGYNDSIACSSPKRPADDSTTQMGALGEAGIATTTNTSGIPNEVNDDQRSEASTIYPPGTSKFTAIRAKEPIAVLDTLEHQNRTRRPLSATTGGGGFGPAKGRLDFVNIVNSGPAPHVPYNGQKPNPLVGKKTGAKSFADSSLRQYEMLRRREKAASVGATAAAGLIARVADAAGVSAAQHSIRINDRPPVPTYADSNMQLSQSHSQLLPGAQLYNSSSLDSLPLSASHARRPLSAAAASFTTSDAPRSKSPPRYDAGLVSEQQLQDELFYAAETAVQYQNESHNNNNNDNINNNNNNNNNNYYYQQQQFGIPPPYLTMAMMGGGPAGDAAHHRPLSPSAADDTHRLAAILDPYGAQNESIARALMQLHEECNRLRSFAATHILSGPPAMGGSSGVDIVGGGGGNNDNNNSNHLLTDSFLLQEAVDIMNERGGGAASMQLDPLTASTSLTLQDPAAIGAAQKLYNNPLNARGISKASRPLSAALDAALISSDRGKRPVSGVATKKTTRAATSASRVRSSGDSWVAKNCL